MILLEIRDVSHQPWGVLPWPSHAQGLQWGWLNYIIPDLRDISESKREARKTDDLETQELF